MKQVLTTSSGIRDWGRLGFIWGRAEGISSCPCPSSTATSKVVRRRMYSACQRIGNSMSLKMRGKSEMCMIPRNERQEV